MDHTGEISSIVSTGTKIQVGTSGVRFLRRERHFHFIIPVHLLMDTGYAVAHLAEALRYKPEGRRFNSR